MNIYLVLLRGINVGGKNKISMADLRKYLEDHGFDHVATYIASGNVILRSSKSAQEVKSIIEEILPKYFKLDDELIKVLVLTREYFQSVFDNKPEGFGEQPGKYHSDSIFLIDIDVDEAMAVFDPREGVDRIWAGNDMIYSQRLSSMRTKSRLNKIMGSGLYKSMTIRSWKTTIKIIDLMNELEKNLKE